MKFGEERPIVKRLLTVLCLGAMTTVGAAERVTVTTNRVNLRAMPNDHAEVVGQVNEGDQLAVLGNQDEWVKVVPPQEVRFWVHEAFVKDGVVQVNRLSVRAGSGINYSTVGYLAQGDEVQEQGRFGEWISIAPPPDSALWVHRELLRAAAPPQRPVPEEPRSERPSQDPVRPQDPDRPQDPPPVVVPPRRPVTTEPIRVPPSRTPIQSGGPSRPVETVEPPPAPSDLNLVPLEGQGKVNEHEGILRTSGFLSRSPTDYRLVVPRGNGFTTVCYVRGNRAQLASFRGVRMRIVGREYWVQGETVPVLVPDKIIPLAE